MAGIGELLAAVSVEEIRRHIEYLEGIRHPVKAPAALERAERYLWEELRGLGYPVRGHEFPDSGGTFRNVIATLSGEEEPEERVMVLAHFDTVAASPGADDNASGVALLLEMGRILSRSRFRRTLELVGVNLEEFPSEDYVGEATRGSRALAATARGENWKIAAVVVLESVGFAGDVPQGAPPVPVEVPARGEFIAVVGNQHSAPLVSSFARVVAQQGIPLPYLPLVVPGNGEILPDARRSDHAPFWDNGFPAIMLTDTANFRNPHYHRGSDTIETLNLPFVAELCRATAALVAELAGLIE